MEGVQCAFDLSSVVCYYKIINYPTLDISTDSTASATVLDKLQVNSKVEQGIEEVGFNLTGASAKLSKLLPQSPISEIGKASHMSHFDTKQKTALSGLLHRSPSFATSVPERSARSSLVIQNGELHPSTPSLLSADSLTSSLKLCYVPITQDNHHQVAQLPKPQAIGQIQAKQTHQGIEKSVTSIQPTLPNIQSKSSQNIATSTLTSTDPIKPTVTSPTGVQTITNGDQHTTQYCCRLCGAAFVKKEDFDDHIDSHVQAGVLSKSAAPKANAAKRGVIRHPCHLCNATFARKYRLTIHIRTHTGEKPYKCNICEKTFKDSDHLRRHVRTHTGLKPYKCQLCTRFFADREHLKRHLNVHNSGRKTRPVT